MATARTPLILVSGQLQQLQSTDRLAQASMTARATIKAGQVIAYDPITNGAVLADAVTYFNVLGLALHDATSGNAVAYASSGVLSLAGWGDLIGVGVIFQGLPWFLSGTSGMATQTQVTSGYHLKLGRFLSSTDFEINLGDSILVR